MRERRMVRCSSMILDSAVKGRKDTDMRFDRSKDPAACAEETKYTPAGVRVIKHDGKHYLAATDGRRMSFVACTPDPEDSGDNVWPVAVIAAARKAAPTKPFTEAKFAVNGNATVTNKDGSRSEWSPLERGRFPDPNDVIPKGKPAYTVTLNAAYLAEIQAALGVDAVTIEFHGNEPMAIRPRPLGRGSDDGSFAVLMPIGAS